MSTFVGRSVSQSVGQSVGWSVSRLVGRSVSQSDYLSVRNHELKQSLSTQSQQYISVIVQCNDALQYFSYDSSPIALQLGCSSIDANVGWFISLSVSPWVTMSSNSHYVTKVLIVKYYYSRMYSCMTIFQLQQQL